MIWFYFRGWGKGGSGSCGRMLPPRNSFTHRLLFEVALLAYNKPGTPPPRTHVRITSTLSLQQRQSEIGRHCNDGLEGCKQTRARVDGHHNR